MAAAPPCPVSTASIFIGKHMGQVPPTSSHLLSASTSRRVGASGFRVQRSSEGRAPLATPLAPLLLACRCASWRSATLLSSSSCAM